MSNQHSASNNSKESNPFGEDDDGGFGDPDDSVFDDEGEDEDEAI